MCKDKLYLLEDDDDPNSSPCYFVDEESLLQHLKENNINKPLKVQILYFKPTYSVSVKSLEWKKL